jgi:hypothetical protein
LPATSACSDELEGVEGNKTVGREGEVLSVAVPTIQGTPFHSHGININTVKPLLIVFVGGLKKKTVDLGKQ